MKREDARILFNKDKDGRISEILVAEFVYEKPEKWPMGLYEVYSSDLGNCLSVWPHITSFSGIFCQLSIDYGFSSRKIAWSAWDELSKIEDWSEEMTKILVQMKKLWL